MRVIRCCSDNVREDLELCNEDLTTATVLARDRADGEGLSKPHRQHKLTEEREEEEGREAALCAPPRRISVIF